MAKLIIEGDSWKVQKLLSVLRNKFYLGLEFKVTFEDDEAETKEEEGPNRWLQYLAYLRMH